VRRERCAGARRPFPCKSSHVRIWVSARGRPVHAQIRVSINTTVVRLDAMRAELDRMRKQLGSFRFSHIL